MKIISIIVLLFTALLFNSCKDNGVGPKPEDKPGRRDYVWTVDTLNIPSPGYKIWGSSPVDVWCINESDHNNSIWHYDGNKWSTDGLFRLVLPDAIWGFSHDQVYIGGEGGRIWRFDGSSWYETAVLKYGKTGYISFENIWGETPSDFFAVGCGPDEKLYANVSVIAHFANNKWTLLNTDILKGDVVHLYKNFPDKKIYFRLNKIGGTEHVDSTIIYELNQEKYNRIFSAIEAKGIQGDISFINGEVYFILGNEIAKRTDNQFHTVFSVDNPNFYQRIWGKNSKDIFLLMTDGLAHYNGTNIEYLFHFTHADEKPWTQIYGAALFEKEVFFTVDEPTTNLELIYHGKLKE